MKPPEKEKAPLISSKFMNASSSSSMGDKNDYLSGDDKPNELKKNKGENGNTQRGGLADYFNKKGKLYELGKKRN